MVKSIKYVCLYCSLTKKMTLLVFSLSDKIPIGRTIFNHLDKFNDKSFISQIFYSNPLCLQVAGWYLEFELLNKLKYRKQTQKFLTLIFSYNWKEFFSNTLLDFSKKATETYFFTSAG